MQINLKKMSPTAKIPTRGSAMAAGYDLYADLAQPITIHPHTTAMISTGIAVEIPEGYFGGIFARSGLAAREMLRPGNCVGVVDSDYRNEIKVALHSDGEEDHVIEPGERIAQLVIIPFLSVEFRETEKLGETERGMGGFGSTGK